MAKENIFLDSYKKEMLSVIKKVKPELSDETILNYLDDKIQNNKIIQNNVKDIRVYNNYKKQEINKSILGIINFYLKKNPIVTGYGVFYKRHDEAENLNASFVQWLMSERKVYKKIQFEGLNAHNKSVEQFGEMMQKTMKLLNNSYYGVTSEKNSQFYNDVIGASITYTGYQIITTSILAFEMFLSDNVKYDNINELLIYLDRIVNKETEYDIFDVLDEDKVVKKLQCYKRVKNILSVELSKEDDNKLKLFIDHCNKEEINKIYYVNNFYEFIENSICLDRLGTILSKDIQDPSKIDDETKEAVEDLWSFLKNFCFYDYNIFNRAERALTMKRKSILTVDTDSNFIYLNNYFEWIKNKFEIDTELDINKFTIINSAVLFLSKFIQCALDRFTGNCNVPVDKQPIINMKSEFYYPRILLTRNKKQYCGLLKLQEGNLIDPPKIDMKGMSIKKANVNNATRKVFTNLIENKILKADNIKISSVLSYFLTFESEIRKSLSKGETAFLTPGKVNAISSYATPERMPVIRGAIAWDALFPEMNIQTPAKVNMLKLKGATLEDLAPIYGTKEYDIIYKTLFEDKKDSKGNIVPNIYKKYGFTSISLPKSIEKIPEFLLPLIDVDSIVEDNERVGFLILESLGINLMTYNNKEYFSTFINF